MSDLQNLESRIARQRSMLKKGADAYERLHADFAEMTKWKRELETQLAALKEENEQLDGVYTGAVDTLEAWHEKRAKARLPMTCQGSVIDGIASLCHMIETLEDKNEGLKARVAELEEGSISKALFISRLQKLPDEHRMNMRSAEIICEIIVSIIDGDFDHKEPANEG